MSSLLHLLADGITHGEMLLWTPDGRRRRHRGSLPGPTVRVRVHDPHLVRHLVRGGAAALGTSWVEGGWTTDDLPATLRMLSVAIDSRLRSPIGQKVQAGIAASVHRLQTLVPERTPVETMAGHYDLGNRFYAAWLDETMSYSSAWLESAHTIETPGLGDAVADTLVASSAPVGQATLVAGQRAKYERLLDRLELAAGDHLLEIGFGWGAMALTAARRGIRVTGVTISERQHEWVRKLVYEHGLQDLVTLHLMDMAGLPDVVEDARFDAAVTVEMIESVPRERWGELFALTRRLVRPGGRVGHQIIMIADDLFETYASREDFITTWIFPGGRLPSPGVVQALADEAGMRTLQVDGFGASYATTLASWWERFDAAFEDDIRPLGFDDRFRRMWHYYLGYCQAGFETGRLDVQQWVLQVAH